MYESLWNLALTWLLIRVDRTGRIRRGGLVAVYVVGYLVARLWLETVRIDSATEIAGLRINIWMSVIGIAVAGGWLLVRGTVPDRAASASVGVEEIEVAPSDDGAS